MRVPTKDRLQPGPEMLWVMLEGEECPRDRAILATAMNTGLRSSSISDLRVGDVDLQGLTLHVRVPKSQIEDSMPLTSDLANELRRWLVMHVPMSVEPAHAAMTQPGLPGRGASFMKVAQCPCHARA